MQRLRFKVDVSPFAENLLEKIKLSKELNDHEKKYLVRLILQQEVEDMFLDMRLFGNFLED